MDKINERAVEWLERRYDEWEFETGGRYDGLDYVTVVNRLDVSDYPVGAWLPSLFSIKADMSDETERIETDQEAERAYWCNQCSWSALIGRGYSHQCWTCFRRITHMMQYEMGQCLECYDKAFQ